MNFIRQILNDDFIMALKARQNNAITYSLGDLEAISTTALPR